MQILEVQQTATGCNVSSKQQSQIITDHFNINDSKLLVNMGPIFGAGDFF